MRINLSKKSKRFRRDAGVALITTLLLLFLMSSLLVGFSILLMTNQQLAGSNNDDVQAFYAAEAGMEQMTANLGDLFSQTYAPTAAQINQIALNPPLLTGISYLDSNGSSGYTITPGATDVNGNPAPTIATIKSGAYSGMTALLTEYTLVVNARTTDGREVKLQRSTQTVGIPMFQFGIFSNTDLSFFPGPDFNFGGRTHTNGNLFLAAGSTLTLSDKVDAYKDVIRTNLENGWPTSSNYTGTVQITTQPGGTNYRTLQPSEGSLTGTLGSSADTNWPTISTGNAPADYNSNLINGQGSAYPQYSTGAKQLNLGIVTMGSGTTQSIDLIRRSVSGESSNVTGERYFAQA
ncbi:MAG TPA: PilX N-terminal domain-containing pilus assembly protein, partial [Candidatus Sulfotelmatobacter sp.]|nr:PilX N-terminal domain-containing pilus assembly protein [Candidatus Sulfotelmatobacter sp.]